MQFFGKSDKGMRRAENQDCFLTEQIYDNALLCVVCDGMGGANGGSTASSMACSSFAEHIKKSLSDVDDNGQLRFQSDINDIPTILEAAVNAANKDVYKKSARSKKLSGMGTTLVSALIIDNTLYTINIGDSRLYFVSSDKITQITHDHSYVQTLIDLGQITPEEARSNPHRNIITKAIGIANNETPDITHQNLDESDTEYILLCSDGLTNFADEKRIIELVHENETPEAICTALIDEANANGGGDNITTVVIKLR